MGHWEQSQPLRAAVAAVGAFGKICVDAAKKAQEFETSMASMSALTGLQGDDLESLGKSARELAKTYGASATGSFGFNGRYWFTSTSIIEK